MVLSVSVLHPKAINLPICNVPVELVHKYEDDIDLVS